MKFQLTVVVQRTNEIVRCYLSETVPVVIPGTGYVVTAQTWVVTFVRR
jgi:hypothetical protein